MPELTIRPYDDGDFEAVVALWNKTDLIRPWNDPTTDIALCRRTTDAELFIAKNGGGLVATIMVGQDGHRGYIYYLAVDPAQTRRGIGRKLVRHAESWLKDRGAPKVQLMIRQENLDVQAFYRRLGYEDNPCRIMQRWFNK